LLPLASPYGADKLLPGGGLLPLWCRKNAAALQDIAHSLVTDGVSQVVQGTRDPVITPGAILLSEAHDQGFQLLPYRRSASDLSLLGAVKLLYNEFPMERIVSGLTIVATSARACLLSLLPIAASAFRSPSFSRTRPGSCCRKRRFSVTRYALRSSSSWSTEPVMYASNVFQSMHVSPPAPLLPLIEKYVRCGDGRQAKECLLAVCNL